MLLIWDVYPKHDFRNQDFIEKDSMFSEKIDYNRKMILVDAQTSGGLLMASNPSKPKIILEQLQKTYPDSSIIGEFTKKESFSLYVY